MDTFSTIVRSCIDELRNGDLAAQRGAVDTLLQVEYDRFFALPELIQALGTTDDTDKVYDCIQQIILSESVTNTANDNCPIWPRAARFGRRRLAHATYRRCVSALTLLFAGDDVRRLHSAGEVASMFLDRRTIWYPRWSENPMVAVLCSLASSGTFACVREVARVLASNLFSEESLVSWMEMPSRLGDRSYGNTRPLQCALEHAGWGISNANPPGISQHRFVALLSSTMELNLLQMKVGPYRTSKPPESREASVGGAPLKALPFRWIPETAREADRRKFLEAILNYSEQAENVLTARLNDSANIVAADIQAIACLPDISSFLMRQSVSARVRLGGRLIECMCSGSAVKKRLRRHTNRLRLATAEWVAPGLAQALGSTTFYIAKKHTRHTDVQSLVASIESHDYGEEEAAEALCGLILYKNQALNDLDMLDALTGVAKAIHRKMLLKATRLTACRRQVDAVDLVHDTVRMLVKRHMTSTALVDKIGASATPFILVGFLQNYMSESLRALLRKTVPCGQPLDGQPEQADPSRDLSGASSILQAELRTTIRAAMDSLSEKDRMILHSLYFEYEPNKSIAARLGVAECTISNRAKQALRKLAQNPDLKKLWFEQI
jgi:RNA polymerase sigma factor (sigma-70 family)